MWQSILETYWPFLLFFVIMLLASWSNHRHNRDAARKGQNPRSLDLSFGRNPFRKKPEQPYAEDRKINRHWKP